MSLIFCFFFLDYSSYVAECMQDRPKSVGVRLRALIQLDEEELKREFIPFYKMMIISIYNY